MRPGPAAAVETFLGLLDAAAPPRRCREWIVDVVVHEGWASSRAEALELGERWEARFLQRLRTLASDLAAEGRPCPFDFNSSSDYLVQGASFIEPGVDSPGMVEAKQNRARAVDYADHLRTITALDFEALCRGILSLLGVDNPGLTPRTADEGLDFYGLMEIGKFYPHLHLPGVQRSLRAWMVGQAKHYPDGHVATPEIRQLVGSVGLVQAGAFSRLADPYPDIRIRLCDPVFYLFFTTGRIGVPGWRLLASSGVVGMDGTMVAAFLADNAVGVSSDGDFDATLVNAWIREHRS